MLSRLYKVVCFQFDFVRGPSSLTLLEVVQLSGPPLSIHALYPRRHFLFIQFIETCVPVNINVSIQFPSINLLFIYGK